MFKTCKHFFKLVQDFSRSDARLFGMCPVLFEILQDFLKTRYEKLKIVSDLFNNPKLFSKFFDSYRQMQDFGSFPN